VPTSYGVDEKRWNRKKAALVMGVITLVFAIPSALSTSVPFFEKLPLFNVSFFSLVDNFFGGIALAVTALLVCVFVGFVWKTSNAVEEIKKGCEKFPLQAFWSFSVKYLSPLLIIFVLLATFGVI
jgi:NSS family neurotransmitter:Na+ symporter